MVIVHYSVGKSLTVSETLEGVEAKRRAQPGGRRIYLGNVFFLVGNEFKGIVKSDKLPNFILSGSEVRSELVLNRFFVPGNVFSFLLLNVAVLQGRESRAEIQHPLSLRSKYHKQQRLHTVF